MNIMICDSLKDRARVMRILHQTYMWHLPPLSETYTFVIALIDIFDLVHVILD